MPFERSAIREVLSLGTIIRGHRSITVPRFWTNYWLKSNWRANVNREGEPVYHGASNNFRERGVSPGDTVYMVSVADGQLYLGGSMTVDWVGTKAEALRRRRIRDIYDAEEHIYGDRSQGTPLNLHRRLHPALARRLRFLSANSDPKGLAFVSPTHIDSQSIRRVRELTPDSASLLDRIIDITDRLPRSARVIIVTERLLRQTESQNTTIEAGLSGDRTAGTTGGEGDWLPPPDTAYQPQYWVVGAMWGGHDDKYDDFIREGYWLLGWAEEEQPAQLKRRDQIRPGDRIAIKKRSGGNRSNIEIRAIGSVTGIDPASHHVRVRWEMTDLHHHVAGHGCFA